MVATTSIAVYQQSMLASCQPEVYTKEEEIHKFMVNFRNFGGNGNKKTDMRFMN